MLSLLVALSGSAHAMNFIVDDTTDAIDTLVGDCVCEASTPDGLRCTLRAAIMEANACPAGTPAWHAVVLPAGTYDLTIRGPGLDHEGDLDITGSTYAYVLGATGVASDVVINANPLLDRIFDIAPSARLDLTDLTLTGGSPGYGFLGGLVWNDGTFKAWDAELIDGEAYEGGAVGSTGTLEMHDCLIASSRAVVGSGGGVWSTGPTDLEQLEFDDNRALGGSGGGLFVDVGAFDTVGLHRLAFHDNQANDGGGAHLGSGMYSLTQSSFWDNTASMSGGGLHTQPTSVTVISTTFSGNQALSSGGYGGGFAAMNNNTHDLRHVTFQENSTAGHGGGLFGLGSAVDVQATVFQSNAATVGGSDCWGVGMTGNDNAFTAVMTCHLPVGPSDVISPAGLGPWTPGASPWEGHLPPVVGGPLDNSTFIGFGGVDQLGVTRGAPNDRGAVEN